MRTHDHIIGTDETKASSSRRKRDLSSVNPSHRQRRSANEVSEEEKQAREAENLRRRNSRKRCFSANLWGYEDPDCWGGSPSVDHGNVGEEECVGLTGDALERCEKAFESVTQTTQEEASPHPSEGHSSRPFFIKYQDNFYMFPVPKRADQEFGVHKHRIMTDSFGGEETRPINVSVVFGIKT
ncbi:Uncharacterised protein [Candidatus Bartonella washoeensis]|uniref:hypothetical protein n=1 Tax=Candidatus Bartonella washoeensis TaxID=186739 RepID=UPI000D9479B9|nr:Uncharacterised protein [Bartonella washoeensis]